MKKLIIICVALLLLGGAIFIVISSAKAESEDIIREKARASSVQLVFHIPILHAWFAKPLPKDVTITEEILNERFAEKIKILRKETKEAIQKEREWRDRARYETFLTDIDAWAEPQGGTFVPLGLVAPKWAKFPEHVLVVAEIEKTEIDPYDEKYKKDVRAISETTGVSLSKAKSMLIRIKLSGYSVSKEQIAKSSKVKLLKFDGWDDAYPKTLEWGVFVEGEPEVNIITGYDPRGILETRHVEKDKKVHVKAGYFDLLADFKEKSSQVVSLESEVEGLKERLEDMEKERDKARKELFEKDNKDKKRDIGKATWSDIIYGRVKVEGLYALSHGTGVFLGNMDIQEKSFGWKMRDISYRVKKQSGIILTNAHVANMAINFEIYVSKDKEHMWIIFPGVAYARYTIDSDYYGSPASVLMIDGELISSWDNDAALMTTTPVKGFEDNAAVLGDSDKIKAGDRVVLVGNPGMGQKFSAEGIITIPKWSILDSIYVSDFFKGMNKVYYNWMHNSSIWFSAAPAIGGTSGSALWALSGDQKGKVVGLHNMGLKQPLGFAKILPEKREIEISRDKLEKISHPGLTIFPEKN